MYHIIFYINAYCERYEGLFMEYPCFPSLIKLIVEYNNSQITNCFNPNDI